MSDMDLARQSTFPGEGSPRGKAWLMLISVLLCLGLAGLSLVIAIPLQSASPTQMGVILVAMGAWLVYSLAFGFGFRATLLFSTLFFLKPLDQTFYPLLLMFVFALVVSYYGGQKRSLRLPHPLLFLVLAGMAIQGLVRARSFGDAIPYFCSTLLVPLTLFLLFANTEVRKTDFVLWIKAIVVVGGILGFIGVIMGVLNPTERLGSLWITAMTINGFYTMAFFLGLGLAMRAELPKEKLFWSLMTLFVFLGMMYTYTRVALLAVVLGLGMIMWRMKRFRIWGIVLLGLVPLAIPASMMMRVQTGFALDYSLFIRLLAWYHSIRLILHNFFFGIGISTWKEMYYGIVPFKFLYAEHPHNLYLKILLEIGIFGFVAYFALIGSVIRDYYRKMVKGKNDTFSYMIWLATVAVLFSCLTDIFVQQYSISVVFWSCLAFMYASSREQTEITDDNQESEI